MQTVTAAHSAASELAPFPPEPGLPTARAECHGQVVDIRPLLEERVYEELFEAALRAAEKRAVRPVRPRLRLVTGGER